MNKPLRIIFMGTPEFAVESLDVLHSSAHEVIAVVTAPDKPAGRGGKMRSSAVKQYCEQNGLTLWQPANLKDPAFINQVKQVNPDLMVVVAFRMLPKVIWEIPAKGTINLHASLLPDYRGAAPINWAIINGETETGVTTFFINENIDTGDIIDQTKVAIRPTMNAGDLHDELKTVGAKLLLRTVDLISSDNVTPTSQKQANASLKLHGAPKITKENTRINWNRPGDEIINLIRGMSPYPGAHAKEGAKKSIVKIFGAEKHDVKLEPGAIQTDGKSLLAVGTSDGSIAITLLQFPGKKRMGIRDFLNGFPNIDQLKKFD